MRKALEILIAEGLEGMAEAIRLCLNESMKIEQSAFLDAEPYE